MNTRAEKASSSVIGVVLLMAITVILAATVSAYLIDLSENHRETPSPIVSQSTGELEKQAGNNNNGGIVRITHQAGDNLNVSDLEISVDATDACGKESRIINLPHHNIRFS